MYAFEDLGRLEALNQGAPGSSYYRYGTPNGSALEAIRQNAALLEFAPSLADVTTTVSYPIATSHQGLPDTALADLQVGAEMIRLSAGIEEPADVIADLDAALAATM